MIESKASCEKPSILLVRPYGYDRGKTSPAYGIISIAKYLRAHGYQATVRDFYSGQCTVDSIVEELGEDGVPFLGVSAMSGQTEGAEELCNAVLATLPHTRVLLGGVHYTVMPEDGPEDAQVVVGPGEKAVLRILQGLVPATQRTVRGEALTDYSFNPLPDAEMLRHQYLRNPDDTLSIITARGCPFSCKFCVRHDNREIKLVEYPLDHVIEYIEMARREFGIRRFFILDDVFFLRRERVEEFCDRVDRLGQGLAFRAFSHTKVKDPAMYERAARSGFYDIAVGVESGNDRILDLIGKGTTVEEIEGTVKMITDAGMSVSGLYMLGNMGETEATVNDTIRFAHHLHRQYGCSAWFSIAQPFPGTAFRDEAPQHGRLLHNNFARYDNEHVSFVPNGMEERDLYRLWRKGMTYGNNRSTLACKMRHALWRYVGI